MHNAYLMQAACIGTGHCWDCTLNLAIILKEISPCARSNVFPLWAEDGPVVRISMAAIVKTQNEHRKPGKTITHVFTFFWDTLETGHSPLQLSRLNRSRATAQCHRQQKLLAVLRLLSNWDKTISVVAGVERCDTMQRACLGYNRAHTVLYFWQL